MGGTRGEQPHHALRDAEGDGVRKSKACFSDHLNPVRRRLVGSDLT